MDEWEREREIIVQIVQIESSQIYEIAHSKKDQVQRLFQLVAELFQWNSQHRLK